MDHHRYAFLTMPDSDSDSASKPNGYIAQYRSFYTEGSQIQILIPTANYRNGIGNRVRTWVRLPQYKWAISVYTYLFGSNLKSSEIFFPSFASNKANEMKNGSGWNDRRQFRREELTSKSTTPGMAILGMAMLSCIYTRAKAKAKAIFSLIFVAAAVTAV